MIITPTPSSQPSQPTGGNQGGTVVIVPGGGTGQGTPVIPIPVPTPAAPVPTPAVSGPTSGNSGTGAGQGTTSTPEASRKPTPTASPKPTKKPATTPTPTPSGVYGPQTVEIVYEKGQYMESSYEVIAEFLTDEEMEAVRNGAEVRLVVSTDVEASDDENRDHVQKILEDMNEQFGMDEDPEEEGSGREFIIGDTYKIEIAKKVGNDEAESIEENASEGVRISIPACESLMNIAPEDNLVCYMIGTDENGNTSISEAQLDRDSQLLNFMSNGSGRFTLAYSTVPYTVKPGTILNTSKKLNSVYMVTKAGNTDGAVGEVTYMKPQKQKASITTKTKVKINGITYKVTAIAGNAFKKDTKLKSISISSSITKIGANAFRGCKNLESITIKSKKLTKKNIGAYAFKNTAENLKVTVPYSKYRDYKTVFKKIKTFTGELVRAPRK